MTYRDMNIDQFMNIVDIIIAYGINGCCLCSKANKYYEFAVAYWEM